MTLVRYDPRPLWSLVRYDPRPLWSLVRYLTHIHYYWSGEKSILTIFINKKRYKRIYQRGIHYGQHNESSLELSMCPG